MGTARFGALARPGWAPRSQSFDPAELMTTTTTDQASPAQAMRGATRPAPSSRVAILAYYYPPANASGAQRPMRFAKYLPEFGFEPHVIAAAEESEGDRPAHARYVPDRASANCERAVRRAAWIQRWILPYDQKFAWKPYVVEAGAALLSAGDIDCIVSTAPPVTTHFAALELKRRFGVPWVADFRDPFYGNPMRVSRRSRWSDFVAERQVVNNADAIIANTETLGESLRQRYPGRANDIVVLMNGYDPEEPLGPASVPTREQKLLSHIGALYDGRKPDVIVQSFLRLIAAGKLNPREVKLDFVGPYHPTLPIGTGDTGELMSQGAMDCPGEVLPRDEANRKMAEADWLLLLDLNRTGDRLQVPAKVFDYVRVERPILAITYRDSPTERLLDQSGLRHVCIDPGAEDEQIDQKVIGFLRSGEPAGRLSAEFQRTYEARNQVSRLASLIERVRH